jgi:ABC-type branched-subunit amino acid transport system ATPase component
MTATALEIRGLRKSFGTTPVLRDVDLSLARGARHALIGPNGAGKTALFKLITGLFQPSAGTLRLDGQDVTQLSWTERKRCGVTRSFRLSPLARQLTVLDNLRLATGGDAAACPCAAPAAAAERQWRGEAFEQLEALVLGSDTRRPVQDLPASRQRLVEIAIALAQRPKLLLLDEPTDGVPSSELDVILDVIFRLDRDMIVLIIEHNMDVVFRIADRVTVLVAGTVQIEGTREEIALRRLQAESTFSRFSPAAVKAMDRIIGQYLSAT